MFLSFNRIINYNSEIQSTNSHLHFLCIDKMSSVQMSTIILLVIQCLDVIFVRVSLCTFDTSILTQTVWLSVEVWSKRSGG